MVKSISQIDRRILGRLQEQGRISNADLAEQVGISTSACHRRLKRLEDEGWVDGYVGRINPKKLGYNIEFYVEITLESQSDDTLSAFEQQVANCPEVLECYLMTGEFDYMLRVAVKDAADYERIHREHISRFPGVSRLRSNLIIRQIMRFKGYPLDN